MYVQAFNTNPVNMVDPTGQSAISDLFWHVLGAVAFVAGAIATGGAAIAAEAAITAAVVAGEEVTAAIASAVLYGIATAANIGAVATSATLIADDAEGLQGHHFLTNDQRNQLSTATLALGGIAAGAGLGGGAAAGADATTVADDAAQTEAAQTRVGPEDVRRNAIVEGEEPDVTFSATNKRNAIVPGEEPSLDLSPPRFVTQNGSEESFSSFSELPPAPEGEATIYGYGGREARFLTDYPRQGGYLSNLKDIGAEGAYRLYAKSLPKVFGQQAGEDLDSPYLRSPHADEEYATHPDWPSAQTPASRSPSTGAQADTGTLGTSNPLAEAGATSITKTLQSNSFVKIGGRRYEVINLT